MSNIRKDARASKIVAMLFLFSGIVFILAAILGDDTAVFLPIGLANTAISFIWLNISRSKR